MTTLVRYVPDARELDLACLDSEDFQLITSLHGQIQRSEGVLICLAPGGGNGELYIRKGRDGSKFFAAHFPGGAHGDDHPIEAESIGHKRQKDYWARAAQDAGFNATTEFPVPGGKLDVAITDGSVPTDIEIQKSNIDGRTAKSRTTRYAKAGYQPVWFNEVGARRMRWLREVPALGCLERSWETGMPAPRSVGATGLTEIAATKCVVGAFDRCPDGKPRPCGRRHASIHPWLNMTVDDTAGMIPAGEIVPLVDRRGIVRMVSTVSFDLYLELNGGKGAWSPAQKLATRIPTVSIPGETAECRNPEHDGRERFCSKCGDEPVGPFGVLCPACKLMLSLRN